MNLDDIFLSSESLRREFEKGLQKLLNEGSLGSYILVLANALFDEKIFKRMQHPLQEKFKLNQQHYTRSLRLGKQLHDAPDDMLVFLKLIAIGFENLNTTEYRQLEDWELQFNQLRSLRPQRMSGASISHLSQKFDDSAFHFNKPFLDKEVFWTGELDGRPVKLLYNKFPFATLHGLLVPEPEKELPQFLTRDIHYFICSICSLIGETIPGIAIAYNGYGAGASINHLHFQTFIKQRNLPVLADQWQHNGGTKPYPTDCMIFEDSDEAWQYINDLHHKNITYNLLYLPGRLACLPRKYQGSFPIPAWTENFAWYELCGGVTTFNKEDFLQLDDDSIAESLARLKNEQVVS